MTHRSIFSNIPQIKYISEPAEYFDMLTSDQILVMGINFVSDEMVEMRYQYKEEFVEELLNHQLLFISLFCTAEPVVRVLVFFWSIAGVICFHMSAITGETILLKPVRSRAIVLHDDSFVENYPVVFVLMYGK